jgi:hypothetical protein
MNKYINKYINQHINIHINATKLHIYLAPTCSTNYCLYANRESDSQISLSSPSFLVSPLFPILHYFHFLDHFLHCYCYGYCYHYCHYHHKPWPVQ